jgi:hypothetical protein
MTPLLDSAYAGGARCALERSTIGNSCGCSAAGTERHLLDGWIGMSSNLLIEPSTPQPQELPQKKIGHFVVDTGHDRPWSQYFCCVLTANRDFVSKYPIATKRALRAFLKGADICANEPQQVAQLLAAKGYEPRHAMALDDLKGLRYDRSRQSDPTDTLRHYALRLHEVGMIKSDPNNLIAEGTNWRFLNELKRAAMVMALSAQELGRKVGLQSQKGTPL